MAGDAHVPAGTLLAVNDLYASVQGEGVLTGVPMIVLRLMGCAVACRFCDTKETWSIDLAERGVTAHDWRGKNARWAYVDVRTLARLCRQENERVEWVLVTGGEPAAQLLGPLVQQLHDRGFKVALETSGTEIGHVGAAFDHVCVSPKLNNPGGRPILDEAIAEAREIKWVVGKAADIDALCRFVQRYDIPRSVRVSVQPMAPEDGPPSKRVVDLCLAASLRFGWALSSQVHKYLDVR